MSLSANRLVFTGKQQVSCEPFTLATPGSGEVLVRSICSLMSTGTENIVYNRLFDPGTHWDKWVKYPFYPGYSTIGEVLDVGDDVTSHRQGDRVALRASHASHHVRAAAKCHAVPRDLDPANAAWFGLAKIAFIGARAASYALGDNVLVIGAGPIGQMSVRWAKAMGCRHIGSADLVEGRLALARRGGATSTFSKPLGDSVDELKAAFGGALPMIVIDTTGHPQVFATALGVTRDRGRVVVLGDTGSPASQHLTPDVITRGLTIIGAHDGHVDDTWNDATIYPFFFELVGSGRFDLDALNTHTFAPHDCEKAYAMVNERRGETMGVVFGWS
jgi:2-desacetyl-2-hydroxyethyl bacteriochlorophyllide A dehydrogenase